ncbi:hypothetical protein BgiBS90_002309 [Biomphalaria glabrata]|nr:hypothetical protein BgiBS90_002309 [Biomphalaria glabrata]
MFQIHTNMQTVRVLVLGLSFSLDSSPFRRLPSKPVKPMLSATGVVKKTKKEQLVSFIIDINFVIKSITNFVSFIIDINFVIKSITNFVSFIIDISFVIKSITNFVSFIIDINFVI